MSVDGVVPAGVEEVFTQAEVVEVLDRTGLDQETRASVLEVFTRFAGERTLANYEAGIKADVVKLAIIYERVAGDGASDSNNEGWLERLVSQSERILRNSENRVEVGRSEEMARKLAALLYVCLSRQSNHDIDLDLLQDAGFGESEILDVIRGELVRAAVSQGTEEEGLREKVNTRYTTLTSIAGGVIRLIWPRLIPPLAVELRSSLLAEGHDLPELNPDGLYPEEIEG